MRTLIGAVVVLALCDLSIAADDKIDAKKLVGKWEEKDPKKGERTALEFTKDGKFIVSHTGTGKDVKFEGTYKVDGNKLTVSMKIMDAEKNQTITITKLTDDELAGEADGDKKAFQRVKDKK